VYGFSVHICVSSNVNDTAFGECEGEIQCREGAATFHRGSDAWIVLREDGFTYGILAHEALHAANYMMVYIGAQPSTQDDEVVAYHTEYIIDQAIEWMSKENIWIK